MLLMSSGKLVKNPALILKYFALVKERGGDVSRAMPGSKDVELVVEAARQGRDLLSILQDLIRSYSERMDPTTARAAVKEVMKCEVDEDTAVYLISRELAAWTLEIAEAVGAIKVSGATL